MATAQRLERIGPFEYQRHAAAMPTLDGDRDAKRRTVAIVGGGPVGLAVALGLARYGVASVVIEADDAVCEGSRAACISRRSLEILDRLGALPAFMAKGLPWTDGRSYYGSTEVFKFSMPHGAHDRLPPMINLQQYYAEQFLVDAVERCNARTPGLIEIRWASEVTSLEQDESGATLTIANPLGTYRLGADWVVACDGGQSLVRKQLGLGLEGTTYDDRYVIIDIELPSHHATERRAWFDPPWNRGSTVLMHKQPDDLWRIDYQVRHGEDAEEALQPEKVRAFVLRHLEAIGEAHLPWKPVWTTVYRAGALTMPSYRCGRVLFAGNAAHVLPIFGVRGLNSGFDDADNLAWKLAFVAHGIAPERLLDSYSDERIAAFHENARNASRSTEFMSPPSRGFDLLREAVLSLAEAHPGIANLINPRQTQSIRYVDSALSSDDEGFESGPSPGEVLQEARTGGAACHLTDALAPGFTCLVFGSAEAARPAIDALVSQADVPAQVIRVNGNEVSTSQAHALLLDPDASVARAYGAREGSIYLVRPDGHVAGRWHRPTSQVLRDALRRACGVGRVTSDASIDTIGATA